MIEVTQLDGEEPFRFEVVVRERGSETRHLVTMSFRTSQELTRGAASPEHCIEAAFRFLLDREPKEAILSQFDVTLISRYFPEFPRELPRYLESH
jgi:hypothetical protein